MALIQEPGVSGSIQSQASVATVEQTINVIVPIDSPSGKSDPELLTSSGDLYKKYGATTVPNQSDHISMLQAYSLLTAGAVWVLRLHDNKILEGITAEGLPFFVDKNKNLIKYREKITLNPPEMFYDNLYLMFKNDSNSTVLVYAGEKPEGVTADKEIRVLTGKFELKADLLNFISTTGTDVTVTRTDASEVVTKAVVIDNKEYLTLDNTAVLVFNVLGNQPIAVNEADVTSTLTTDEDIVNADINKPLDVSYPAFMNSLLSLSSDDFTVTGTKTSSGYTLYSSYDVTGWSSNLTNLTSTKLYSFVNATIDPSSEFTAKNFFMIDDTSYYIQPESGTIEYTYPSASEPIEFIKNEDSKPGYDVYSYLLDILANNYSAKVESCSGTLKKSFTSLLGDVTIETNLTNYFTVDNNTISTTASLDLISDGYIKLSFGSKTIVIYIGSSQPAIGASYSYPVAKPVTSVKLLTMLTELTFIVPTDCEYESTDLSTNLGFIFDSSKCINYSIDFPTGSSSSITPTYKIGASTEVVNTSNVKINDVSIIVNDVEYTVGNPTTTLPITVKLSDSGKSVTEIAQLLTNNLPNDLNPYCYNNLVDTFTTSTTLPKVEGNGIQVSTSISNFDGIKESCEWGAILSFNSRAKVAKFSWSWDYNEELYQFECTVNSETFSSNFQTKDASKVDGYGKSLYYQYINDNFGDFLEIIPFDGERNRLSYESPSFGNAIAFNPASTGDLDTALGKLSEYKFTKWDIIADGGYVTPGAISIFAKHGAILHSLADCGSPGYSQLADMKDWANNLPQGTPYLLTNNQNIKDTSFDGFSVEMSACVAHIKRIFSNTASMNEFQPIYGASNGTITGTPITKFDETERTALLNLRVNSIINSKELSLNYFNDNLTHAKANDPLEEEQIMRMANASHHVMEVWLELNAVGHNNKKALRDDIEITGKEVIENRLHSGEKCYKDLEVICNESNGNSDSKTEVYVEGYLTPYRSTKRIKLFTIVKNLATQNSAS